jgi:acetate kinase
VADVLVVDAGSHSLRLVLVSPAGERAWEQTVESPPGSPEADRLLATFGHQVGSFGAVGYRIVHGGREVT